MRPPRYYDQDFMAQRWSHERGSTVVNVMKAVAIVSSLHLNVAMIFVVSHFFSAKVSPEWR